MSNSGELNGSFSTHFTCTAVIVHEHKLQLFLRLFSSPCFGHYTFHITLFCKRNHSIK